MVPNQTLIKINNKIMYVNKLEANIPMENKIQVQ